MKTIRNSFNIACLVTILLTTIGVNIVSFIQRQVLKITTTSFFINKVDRWLMLNEYAFYSPNIPSGYTMILTTKDSNQQLSLVPVVFNSFEMQQKIFSFYHVFHQDTLVRNIMANSVAAYFLNRYPALENLQMSMFEYYLPTIAACQQGDKPRLGQLYYYSTFEHRKYENP
ncbi:MAG: hypothetical protein RLZZ628_1262 [Bacteroidota bacterium]|jgi:hypothetical protein